MRDTCLQDCLWQMPEIQQEITREKYTSLLRLDKRSVFDA